MHLYYYFCEVCCNNGSQFVRECAQHLIETPNFLHGAGVTGRSALSSRVSLSTSNTHLRPARPDDNSIPCGCPSSNHAAPNSAPSVSESARQEHNRIFE